MPTEPIASLPYPAATAAPDVPADLMALVNAIAPKLNMVFASTLARDAAIPAPVVGMRAVVGSRTATTDTLWEYRHDGYQWQVITSPWQDVAPAAGFTGSGSVGVRLMGGIVTFRGSLTGSITQTVNTQVGTIPAGFRPTQPNQGAAAAADDQTGTPALVTWVDAGGGIWVRSQATTGTRTLSLGAISRYSVI